MSKTNIVIVGLLTLTLLASLTQAQTQCTTTLNTYWTGYRCACKVGYKNSSDTCVPLTLMRTQGWVVREPTILANSTDNSTNVNNGTDTPVVSHNCYLPF